MIDRPPIIFIRHGETDWNRARRIQGRADVELNEVGLAQARAVASRLLEVVGDPGTHEYHCSPLLRAKQTMAAVLAQFGLAEESVTYDERLSERAFGEFDGRNWAELFRAAGDPALEPAAYYAWRPEEGESYAEVSERVAGWLATLSRPAIVVSHSGVSRALRGLLLNLRDREIVHLPVPQDRFFRVAGGRLQWFDARRGGP